MMKGLAHYGKRNRSITDEVHKNSDEEEAIIKTVMKRKNRKNRKSRDKLEQETFGSL